MRALILCLAVAASSAQADTKTTFEGTCGTAIFHVTRVTGDHPLANVFTLTARTRAGERKLYVSDHGGWFHAACLTTTVGGPVLVFQSYCGGSACLEGNFGAVDPANLKRLLRPSTRNGENYGAITALLGYPAPHLGHYEDSFCCEP